MIRKTSDTGIKLIKSYEGVRLTAYKPVPTEEFYTIGWGHYGPDIKAGATITRQQADDMFVKDLAKYEAYVNNPAYVAVTAQLNQNQFDALVSFTYNCGNGNLQKLCKGRSVQEIGTAMIQYDKSSGKSLPGLTRRRKEEQELYFKAATEPKGENDLELTNYQWDTLRAQVKALLDSGRISDKSWLTKIDNKTLTTSELAWLAFIVAQK